MVDFDDADEIEEYVHTQKLFQSDGIVSELAMLRNPSKPMSKNNRIVLIFLSLMTLTFGMNAAISLESSTTGLMVTLVALLLADLAVFLSVWLSKSSYIEQSKSLKMSALLETFDCESLCPFCNVIRLPKSRHCNICGKCVDRYDHHCPWVNNCIGRANHSRFYAHLILILAYCTTSLINAIATLVSDRPVKSEISSTLTTGFSITLLVFASLFGLLVLALFTF